MVGGLLVAFLAERSVVETEMSAVIIMHFPLCLKKGGNSVEKYNNLSDNLRAYQNKRKNTLSEFSKELGIAKSTLQSVMMDGNTTVDTLIRIASALKVTLDELVFGNAGPKETDRVQCLLNEMKWYIDMPTEKQEKFRSHLNEMLNLLGYDG